MAVTVNNFSIIENGSQLAIDVSTGEGYNITSISLWNIDTFKDYDKVISLNYKLEQINNKEVFIVDATEVGANQFIDAWFIEVISNEPATACDTCGNPVLAITYNLLPYYNCMLDILLKMDIYNFNDLQSKNLVLMINLLIDSIPQSIDLGYYTQVINNINKLKKLCSLNKCTNCKKITCKTCGQFKQS